MFLGPEGKEQARIFARVGGVGLELGAAIAVGYFGGGYLDEKFATTPWLQWIGFGLGVAAGFRSLFRLRHLMDEPDGSSSEQGSSSVSRSERPPRDPP